MLTCHSLVIYRSHQRGKHGLCQAGLASATITPFYSLSEPLVNSPTFIGGPAVYELGGPAVYSLGGPAVIYVYYIPAAPLGSIEYQVPVAEKCPPTPLPAIEKMESSAIPPSGGLCYHPFSNEGLDGISETPTHSKMFSVVAYESNPASHCDLLSTQYQVCNRPCQIIYLKTSLYLMTMAVR
jgi:hypothetical protein